MNSDDNVATETQYKLHPNVNKEMADSVSLISFKDPTKPFHQVNKDTVSQLGNCCKG